MNTFIMESSVVRPATNPYGRLERNSVVGYEGEHNSRSLVVETTDDLSAYASVSLIIDDLDCGAMTKTTSGSKTVLSLTLTSAMIGASGRKLCQLLMVDSNNTVIAKSSQFVILIKRSNDIERSVEDGVSFIIISEAVTEMAQEAASAAAQEAAADVVAECQTIANTAAGSASAAAQSAAAAQAAAESIVVDSTLDTASTNAIQNKAVAGAISELRADLGAQTGLFHWNERGLIDLSGSSVNLTPETNQGIDYAVIDCSAGDKFIITATGGNKSRVWGFIDENNAILTVSDANATVENFEITAPTNAVKLILNAYRNSDIYAYKVGNNLATKASNGLSDEVKEAILDCFRNVGWLDETDGKESFNALLEAFDMSNFYNTWEWSYPGELVMGKAAPSFLEGSQTDGILYNNNASSQKNRRFPVVNRGKLKCVEYEEVPGDIYPIPIPKDATSVTVTIAPATMYLFLIRWVIQGGVYKLAGSKLWTQGTSTLSFDAASNAFLSINIKYDSSSNTTFATEPQGLEITFE